MKVLGINGSPRKEGNTADMIRTVFEELEKEGIETQFFQLGGMVLRGCAGCRSCFDRKDERCVFDDDGMNDVIALMKEANGIIIGSPTYFADLTSETKALIDRAGYVGLSNGGLFTRKVGAAVVAVRRAGAVHVFDSINHFFFISQMMVPGSSYWNLGIGRNPGEFLRDEEGIATMRNLGRNMAWLLQKISG